MTPNALAPIAIVTWPLVVLAIFASPSLRGRPARATAWAMFLGLMFLPSAYSFKIAGIPYFDKHRITALSIAVALELFHWRPVGQAVRGNKFCRLVFAVMVWGALQTVRTNGDALQFGPTTLPALDSHEAISIVASLFLDRYLPFAIGVRVFRDDHDIRDLFGVLSTCALIYVPFCLFEIRFSPQLHTWVYGYFPHEFWQMVRGGSYRPLVFMSHGLVVATFMFSAFLASLALRRTSPLTLQPSAGWRAGIIGVMTLLCRSLGSILYALFAWFAERMLSRRALAWVLIALSIVVVGYPLIRTSPWFPRGQVLTFFGRLSHERAESLRFRLDQEQQLVARALERPTYGWGSWGRNQIFAPWGQKISIADGQWVIEIGTFGYVGFIAFFALMLTPVLVFVWFRRSIPPHAQDLCAALALMLALYSVDMLPNSLPGFVPITYAGALLASTLRLARGVRPATRQGPAAPPQDRAAAGRRPGFGPARAAS